MALVRVRSSFPESALNMMNAYNLFQDVDRVFNQNTISDVDLYETDDSVVLEMAVPGFNPEDIDINLEGRKLSVHAKHETKEETNDEQPNRRYWLKTRTQTEISRTFTLPSSVVSDEVEATVKNGVLNLVFPKATEAQVKKIAISNN